MAKRHQKAARQQRRIKSIDAVARPPILDTALADVAGITAMVPLAGGPLAAGVNEWRAEMALRRLTNVLLDFHEDLGAIEDRDEEFVRSAAFEAAFDATLASAIQARHAEKRRYYAAALAHTTSHHRPDDWERPIMLDTLDALRPAHLALLAAVAIDPSPPQRARAYLEDGTAEHDRLLETLRGVSEDTLDRCWEDLAGLRLLDSISLLTANGPQLAAHIPDEAIVTPFGRRFMAFITSPADQR